MNEPTSTVARVLLLFLVGCLPRAPAVDEHIVSDGDGSTGASTSQGPGTAGPMTDTGDSTFGPPPGWCGNGILDDGEECDDEGPSDACNLNCTHSRCGDGIVNPTDGEQCDGLNFDGQSCFTRGYADGTLTCRECKTELDECSILSVSATKKFNFAWPPADGASFYQLYERREPEMPRTRLGSDIRGTSVTHILPLHLRHLASYELISCTRDGNCTPYADTTVTGGLVDAIGTVNASNLDSNDLFGQHVALSGDGRTLAVGAPLEDSSETEIDGNEAIDVRPNFNAGAVYIYAVNETGDWVQQAYIKAPNAGEGDQFGIVALSHDGDVLAVGAPFEDSDAAGVYEDGSNDRAENSGAVYIFEREREQWSLDAYIKASNTDPGDQFGYVSLNTEGDVLAVGAPFEDSGAVGVDDDSQHGRGPPSGAVYVYSKTTDGWSFESHIKAPNPGDGDEFGLVKLDGAGDTMAVAAPREDGSATGVNQPWDDDAPDSGAVYIYSRENGTDWNHDAYIKASNTGLLDFFGGSPGTSCSIALSLNGDTLAVGAPEEDSHPSPLPPGHIFYEIGATYMFTRSARTGQWTQQDLIKAPNPDANDRFGSCNALNDDGTILAVSAPDEYGSSIGIGGNRDDNQAPHTGAVYIYELDGAGDWISTSYVKPPRKLTDFSMISLNGDGCTLTVGAPWANARLPSPDGNGSIDLFSTGTVFIY